MNGWGRRKARPQGKDTAKAPDVRATLPQVKRSRSWEGVDIIEFASGPCGVSLHPAQRAILRAIYRIRMAPDELDLYRQMAQGGAAPTAEAVEAVLCLGARSGKSLMVAIVALFETIVNAGRWRAHLRKNEVGYGIIVATRLKQAQDIIQGNAARADVAACEFDGRPRDCPGARRS